MAAKATALQPTLAMEGDLRPGRMVLYPPPANMLKNLVYGGTAGLVGALIMFPLDTAKTRVQNEKIAPGKQRMYRGIMDALVKIGRTQGRRGLYNGLQIQIIGIIPEKALKLSVNDSMRYRLRNEDRSISFLNETVAGAIAGFSQVIITSPMEMLKIRLQVEAALPRVQQRPPTVIVREVLQGGIPAIYRGVGATLLRDVPFSFIYFPLFSNFKAYIAMQPSHTWWGLLHQKQSLSTETNINKRINFYGAFVAGWLAGGFAAWAVTPADVIKTRLQSQGGIERWVNIRTCFHRTLQEEGPMALFKGARARVLLVGSLFGIVLATYELLPKVVPI